MVSEQERITNYKLVSTNKSVHASELASYLNAIVSLQCNVKSDGSTSPNVVHAGELASMQDTTVHSVVDLVPISQLISTLLTSVHAGEHEAQGSHGSVWRRHVHSVHAEFDQRFSIHA